MMTRSVLAIVLLALLAASTMGGPAAAPAADKEVVKLAVGDGTMAFASHEDNDDDHEEGRAYLRFKVREDGDSYWGHLLFAAEHHHERFPDIVVNLGTIEEASFNGRVVKFKGPGQLHDDPVTVEVRAYDKGKHHDRFVIKCTDSRGRIAFEADGEMIRGNISVGEEEEL